MARVFIGVAWPYANSHIHIGGFAGVYLPADIFARFRRLAGDEVLMVSGSDAHGTPILVAAEEQGATPLDVFRRYHEENQAVLEKLGISFDLFTHTHTPVHERTVQELFLALLENGYIARRVDENPYCPQHHRFLPDRYVLGTCPHCGSPTARGDECDRCGRVLEPRQLGDPKCRLCGHAAEFRPSEHFFLLLDKLAPSLERYLADKGYWRDNVVGVTRNFLDVGLHPTPITRDLDWGVPIPLEGYRSKRFYVWFDAVIGYLSASREWAIRTGHPEAWQRFWEPSESVRSYYFLGKDNIFFHTVLWPSILLGQGRLAPPYDVPANEWMQIGGRKISKSRPDDVGAFLPALAAKYPADVIRFYAALLAPENHDTEYDPDELRQQADEVAVLVRQHLVRLLPELVRVVLRVVVLRGEESGVEPDHVGGVLRGQCRQERSHVVRARLRDLAPADLHPLIGGHVVRRCQPALSEEDRRPQDRVEEDVVLPQEVVRAHRLGGLPEPLPCLRVSRPDGPFPGRGEVPDDGVEPDVEPFRAVPLEGDRDPPVEVAGDGGRMEAHVEEVPGDPDDVVAPVPLVREVPLQRGGELVEEEEEVLGGPELGGVPAEAALRVPQLPRLQDPTA